MGKSSSGKDTIYRELIKTKELGLKKIVSYTTRPMREGETDGVQYLFKNEEEYKKLRADNKIIEERAYDTKCGIWRYFTADEGQIDLKRCVGEAPHQLHLSVLFERHQVEDRDGERTDVLRCRAVLVHHEYVFIDQYLASRQIVGYFDWHGRLPPVCFILPWGLCHTIPTRKASGNPPRK